MKTAASVWNEAVLLPERNERMGRVYSAANAHHQGIVWIDLGDGRGRK